MCVHNTKNSHHCTRAARKDELQQDKDALSALQKGSTGAGSADGGAGSIADYDDAADAAAGAEEEEEEEYRDPRDPESWGLDDEDEEHEAYHAAVEVVCFHSMRWDAQSIREGVQLPMAACQLVMQCM